MLRALAGARHRISGTLPARHAVQFIILHALTFIMVRKTLLHNERNLVFPSPLDHPVFPFRLCRTPNKEH